MFHNRTSIVNKQVAPVVAATISHTTLILCKLREQIKNLLQEIIL